MEFNILAHGERERLFRAYLYGLEAGSITAHGDVIQWDFKSIDGNAGKLGDQGILHGVFNGERHTVFKVFQSPERIDLFQDDRRYADIIPGT
ncbi:MAG: hypothetical protein ABFD70_00505 [Syntrophaceae bacterium]|nr:hypothetical protein [Deltaproteobacteria bacterium]